MLMTKNIPAQFSVLYVWKQLHNVILQQFKHKNQKHSHPSDMQHLNTDI